MTVNWMFIAAFLFIFTLKQSPQALAKTTGLTPKTECQSITSPQSGTVCITQVEESRNHDVVYFFHGAGGDARTWSTQHAPIYREWENLRVDPPTVISFSFGLYWLIPDHGVDSTLEKGFLEELIPKAEENLKFHVAKRMLVGRSLGGFNAAYLAMRHPDMFYKVALVSPAILSISPFDNTEVSKYIARTGADILRVNTYVNLLRQRFSNEEEYNLASALKLVAHLRTKSVPQFFISCGDHDQYGFSEGSKKLSDQLLQLNLSHEWLPISGGLHSAIPHAQLAKFLAD